MEHNPVDNQQFESFVQLQETPEEIAFELRAQEGALWTGGRLLIGIWAFAFAALAFAYFYLRSANNEDLWRPTGHHGADGRRRSHLRHHGGQRAPGAVRRAALPRERDPRLAGGRLDGRPRGAAGHRAPDLADDGPPLLPGIERLRLLLHRLGCNEHRPGAGRDLLARDHPGEGDAAASGHCARRRGTELDACPSRVSSGPTSTAAPTSGDSSPSSPPSSGYCSTSSEPGG